MTTTEVVEKYAVAFMRARSRVKELGIEEIAAGLHLWLCGPNNVGRAVDHLLSRGDPTETEVMNLLSIADREPLLRLSCDLQGLPTTEEWLTRMNGEKP
jgi:hypothetical protein